MQQALFGALPQALRGLPRERIEEALLGVLLGLRHVGQFTEMLEGSDFGIAANRRLYEEIVAAAARQSRPASTVRELLRQGSSWLREAGADEWLDALAAAVPPCDEAIDIVLALREHALRDALRDACQAALAQLDDAEGASAAQAAAMLAQDAGRVLARLPDETLEPAAVRLVDCLRESFLRLHDRDDFFRARRPEAIGIELLDRAFGGFRPGEVVVIASDDDALACAVFDRLFESLSAAADASTMVFTLGLAHQEWLARLACARSGIGRGALHRGDLGEPEWSRFIEVFADFEPRQCLIDDRPGLAAVEVARRLRATAARGRLDWAFLDELPMPPHEASGFAAAGRLGALRALARELSVTVLVRHVLPTPLPGAPAQMLRALHQGEPSFASADAVLFMRLDEASPLADAEAASLYIGKHPHSVGGRSRFLFHRDSGRLEEAPPRTAAKWAS